MEANLVPCEFALSFAIPQLGSEWFGKWGKTFGRFRVAPHTGSPVRGITGIGSTRHCLTKAQFLASTDTSTRT
jgi:hypothetical protein